jgi:antitoxin Phd
MYYTVSTRTMAVKMMTSLHAQNHFGEMIDTSQHEPVIITRHGRPVSFVISPMSDPKTTLFQFMKVLRELSPIPDAQAAEELQKTLLKIGKTAEKSLTESDVTQMIHESD